MWHLTNNLGFFFVRQAFQSRQRFLNENLIKVKYFETDEGYQGDEHSDTSTSVDIV